MVVLFVLTIGYLWWLSRWWFWPYIQGGKLLRPLLRPRWRFSCHFFQNVFIIMTPTWRKKIMFEILFHSPQNRLLLFGGSCCAGIEVLTLRLLCSSWDWGAILLLNLGLSTSISAWAPQSRHEHLNLGMSTSILAWAPHSRHENLNLGINTSIPAQRSAPTCRGSPPCAIF